MERGGDRLVETPQYPLDMLIRCANDGERRILEVSDRTSLAEEFRIGCYPEILPNGLRRCPLDNLARTLNGAGQNSAPNHESVEGGLRPKGTAKFLGNAKHVVKVETAVTPAGRSDTHHADVGLEDRLHPVHRCSEHPLVMGRSDQGGNLGFDNRRLPLIQAVDLQGVDIHPYDLMSIPWQTGRHHATHIPKPEYADVHMSPQSQKFPRTPRMVHITI